MVGAQGRNKTKNPTLIELFKLKRWKCEILFWLSGRDLVVNLDFKLDVYFKMKSIIE